MKLRTPEKVTSELRRVRELLEESGAGGISIDEIHEETKTHVQSICTWIDLWGRIGKLDIVREENGPVRFRVKEGRTL